MRNQSLQDQLLNAGLSTKTKAKQVRTEKRKQTKQQRKDKKEVVSEATQALQESKEKQTEKDKLLNKERQDITERKQILSQVADLIKLNKLPRDEEGNAYRFTDNNVVKSVYINDEVRNHIVKGKLAIVKAGKKYEIVPAAVAEKIKQRNEYAVIVLFTDTESSTDNSEYAEYEIPDDLMW
jgi:uncharacterized protein YaiL (DUF2058 family)